MTSPPAKIDTAGWPQRLSLRAILYAGFGAVALAALVSLAGALAVEQLAENSLQEYRRVHAPLAELASRASDAFLRARRTERDYFLALRVLGVHEARARYIPLWRKDLDIVLSSLAKATEPGAEHGELAARITRAAALLKQYESAFLATTETAAALGFQDAGLEGEMRRAAQALAGQLAERGAADALAQFMELHGSQKDYMLRGRTHHATAFLAGKEPLRRRIRAWGTAAPAREAALSYLAEYVDSFERYVALWNELESERADYLALADKLEPDLLAMQYEALAGASQAIARLDNVLARSIRSSAAIDLVALLMALCMALLVTRSITRATQRIGAFAQAVAKGDLGARLPPSTGRELHALGTALNRMADGLQEQKAARDRLDAEVLQLNADLETRVAQRTAELERVNGELTVRGQEILLASELTSALQSALSLEEAATLVARYLERLLPGACGAVYTLKPSGHYLELLAPWGNWRAAEATFALEDCWALRRGQTYAVDKPQHAVSCGHAGPEPLSPYACIPLTAQAAMLGLLHVRFPQADAAAHSRELAEQLAQQLSLALANLNLRDRLREQSIRDPLTGLYNRRYLEETLERELARARREGKPLAVFMLDVDHFKKFNDTHGHDAGDEVLRALGRTLKSNSRLEDVACRFGGEEFTVVLPGASAQAASDWAGRLMSRVRAMQVKTTSVLPPVTISLGLAVFPAHGEDAETLLRSADEALYEAKRAGRDRMVVAGLPKVEIGQLPQDGPP